MQNDVLFVSYRDTLGLLSVQDALAVCEQVYLMHARGSVVLASPPSFKLDVADGFNNHWHVKSVFLKLKPGCTFISLARRELDPAGWRRLDKVVIDSWEFNMLQREFKRMVEAGQFSRNDVYAEIHEIVAGAKQGRARADERILIHTTGLVSQDVALAHFVYRRAVEKGLGIRLPRAGVEGH